MVGRDGFEPSTNWLKANCSTTELTPQKRVRIILREKKNSSIFAKKLPKKGIFLVRCLKVPCLLYTSDAADE